ncbi:ABC transporter ATP-binding protein [Nocardioides sp. AE5]|uniref:ABC transporter ATP-binding protein n=1 Tax=Nocardioides sp. AE5 TaxID=2962573 RepID=UPI0028821092|nr:ABC transporter ATP-binding protein [Nocardioides sp. AE5]MDT0203796.1 ABC transporter ATP-binding protein [Nocardioides sp. AE5]
MADIDLPTTQYADEGDGPPTPSLIVDDVHVTYKTYGGKRLTQKQQRNWKTLGRHVGAVDSVHAVKGITFVAHHGQSIGIIGHNGSGKSTLLRAIAGVLPTSDGRIWTNGTASLLGVNAALMPQLSGERNIVLGGLALGLTPAEVAERFDEVVEFADIGEFVQLPMAAYSSGMGARLRFAISSAARPDILLIDEALSTGDAEFRARSRDRVDEIRAEAGTVLLVSHSMSTIRQMCDRTLWIDHGVLKMDGSTDEVLEAYAAKTGKPAAKKSTARPKPLGHKPAPAKDATKEPSGKTPAPGAQESKA